MRHHWGSPPRRTGALGSGGVIGGPGAVLLGTAPLHSGRHTITLRVRHVIVPGDAARMGSCGGRGIGALAHHGFRATRRRKCRRRGHVHDPAMDLHPAVIERLARLAPDQRAAATIPPGPVLCVAPAGQRQDDDARRPDRVAAGLGCSATRPDRGDHLQQAGRSRARRAAGGGARATRPGGVPSSGAVRVRTFHALGLEILRDAGRPVAPLVDRIAVLRRVAPEVGPGRLAPARHGVLEAQARPRR